MLVTNYTKDNCPNCTRMHAAYQNWRKGLGPGVPLTYRERDAVECAYILKARGHTQAPVWDIVSDDGSVDVEISGLKPQALLEALSAAAAADLP